MDDEWTPEDEAEYAYLKQLEAEELARQSAGTERPWYERGMEAALNVLEGATKGGVAGLGMGAIYPPVAPLTAAGGMVLGALNATSEPVAMTYEDYNLQHYGAADPTTGQVLYGNLREPARDALEMAGGMLPVVGLAKYPGIVQGAGSLLGESVARTITEASGLRDPGTAFDDYFRLNPIDDPIGVALNPVVSNLVVPGGQDLAGYARNRGMTRLGIPSQDIRRLEANNAFDAAMGPDVVPATIQTTDVSPTSAKGARNRQALRENTPYLIESGVLSNQSVITDPMSPDYGKWVGGPAENINVQVENIRTGLSALMQNRNIALEQADAMARQRGVSDPVPVTAIDQSMVQVQLPGSNGTVPMPLNQAVQVKAQLYRQSGQAAKADALVSEYMANKQSLAQMSDSTLVQKYRVYDEWDKAIDDAGGFEPTRPDDVGATSGKIEALQMLREATSGAIGQVVTSIDPALGNVFLKSNEAYNKIKPFLTQLENFSGVIADRRAASIPRKPATALEIGVTLNPANLRSSQGPLAQAASDILSPSRVAMEEAQMGEYAGQMYRYARDIPKNLADISRLRQQGAPDQFPEFDYRPLSSATIAGGSLGRAMEPNTSISGATIAGLGMIPAGPAMAESVGPNALQTPLHPPGPAVQLTQPIVPRSIDYIDPQGVANLLFVNAPDQDRGPLMLQWKQVVSAGDKRQIASFLGAVVEKFPDFPIPRGPVTGLGSEFDLGDGRARLFSPTDIAKWEEQIEKSPLREEEKALRIMALRKDGIVVPMSQKLNSLDSALQGQYGASVDNVLQTHQFKPRQQTAFGSRRIE